MTVAPVLVSTQGASWWRRVRERQHVILALSDQGVTSVATFAAGVLVARSSSPSAFGIYTIVTVALVWANGTHAALVTTPYTYQQGRSEDTAGPVYSGSVLLHHWLLTALAALGAAVAVALLVGQMASPALYIATVIATAGVLVKEYVRATCYAHARFGRALVVNLASVVLQLAVMTALWKAGHLSVALALACAGAAPLLVGATLIVRHAARSRFDVRASLTRLGTSWSLSRWLLAGLVVSVLTRDAYPWALATFHGPDMTGHYAAHLNIALLANPAVIGITNYLAPTFARVARDSGALVLNDRVRAVSLMLGMTMLAYAIALVLGGSALSALIYGERLRAFGPTIGVLALGLGVTAFSMPYGTALVALGRADINMRAALTALVTSLLVGIPAMLRFGVEGAAMAYLLSAVVEHAFKSYHLSTLVTALRAPRTRP